MVKQHMFLTLCSLLGIALKGKLDLRSISMRFAEWTERLCGKDYFQ